VFVPLDFLKENCAKRFPKARFAPLDDSKRKSENPQEDAPQKGDPFRMISPKPEDSNSKRKSGSQQRDLLAPEGDSLGQTYPNRKTETEKEIRNATGRSPPERRLIKKSVCHFPTG